MFAARGINLGKRRDIDKGTDTHSEGRSGAVIVCTASGPEYGPSVDS